jgi:hypothetical protein
MITEFRGGLGKGAFRGKSEGKDERKKKGTLNHSEKPTVRESREPVKLQIGYRSSDSAATLI